MHNYYHFYILSIAIFLDSYVPLQLFNSVQGYKKLTETLVLNAHVLCSGVELKLAGV